MFQELVKEDEEAFRLASAESDKIKAMMNEKYGPGTVKYGSEIKQPEIKTPQAIFEFSQRNPAAEGGRMRFDNGLSAKQKKALTITYPKDATKDLEIKKSGNQNARKPLTLEMEKRIENFETKTEEKYLDQKSWKQHDIRSGAWTGEGIEVKLTDKMKENIKEFEERTGQKYEDLDNQKKKALRDDKKVGVLPSKEEMKLKISVNNDGVPKFPNKKMEQKFIKDIKNKYKYPDGSLNTPDELKAKGLAERYPISERQVERATKYYRDKFNLKYPEGAGSSDAAKKRYKYLKKNSNLKFENLLTGNSQLHKSHMSDLYTQDVRTGTLGYAKAKINTESLKEIDIKMSSLYKKRDKILKNKPKNLIMLLDEINQKGTDLAAQSGGYKKFEAIDPITKKSFVINFSSAAQELDPTDILENKKLSELTNIDKSTIVTLKESSLENIDYIDGKKDFVGVNSGFNTDLLMKDPAVQKILNSKAGQAVKNAARGTAGTVGKVFGGIDIVIGALDYENNISKGQKPNEALGNAVQAMSFNLYKSGDKARIEDVKKRFVTKGGDGEIFDQATALNAKDQEINDLIFNNKKKADTFVRYAKEGRGNLTPDLEKSKTDYNVLKKNLNEEIKNKIQERDGMVESYKTNLRVSEAGAPIQIGNKDFFSKPFKDIKRTTMDKIAEENKKAYDMQKRQVNFTSGNIGNYLQNNIFTMSAPEKTELQKQINNMDERELYKFNLQRGMDPDNLIRFEDILRYKTNDPALMGVNTTKYVNYDDRKAEGGIIGLRSKYEYKK